MSELGILDGDASGFDITIVWMCAKDNGFQWLVVHVVSPLDAMRPVL
jgi:hypothetical protein